MAQDQVLHGKLVVIMEFHRARYCPRRAEGRKAMSEFKRGALMFCLALVSAAVRLPLIAVGIAIVWLLSKEFVPWLRDGI
jgi:hypothetical protein